MRKQLLLSACIAIFTSPLFAQGIPVGDSTATDDETETVAADTTKKAKELQPVEVRAIRAASLSPFAKTDLSKQDIAKQNVGQDLPVLLQFTPSAVTTSDAGAGIGYTGIRIRGTDPTRINVTFNGIPVNDPEEQNTFFVDIPDIASSASSIQIQRGVGTSTNGAGAFGGTISINNLAQMDTAGALMSSSYGSFNTFKSTLMAGTGKLKGGWQFDLRLSRITSEGYIKRSGADLRSLQFTAGWQPTERTAFHFLFMPGTEKTGQAWNGVSQDSINTNRRYNELGQKADGTFYNNQTDNYAQQYYQLFADHRFSNSLSGHAGLFLTRGLGYYEEYKTGQPYSAYYLPPVVNSAGDTLFSQTDLIRRLYLNNYYYGGIFSLFYTGAVNLTLGGGWNQFINQGYGKMLWAANGGVPDNHEWYRFDAQKNDLNIYLKADKRLGDLLLFGDVQYRNIAYNMNGFQNYPGLRYAVNYNFFNPKAGVTYLLKEQYNNHQHVFASVAVANREPARSTFQVDSANLPRPERLTDFEAGYQLNTRKVSAGANIYYMAYKDQLVLTGEINQVGAYVQTNVAQSYRAGIEMQAAWQATPWCTLAGNITVSQNKINNFTEYLDNYDSTAQRVIQHGTTDIAFSPNLIGAGTAMFYPWAGKLSKRLELDVITKHVGRQYMDNTSNKARSLYDYTYTNLLLKYSFHTRTFREVAATLLVNNVLGRLYNSNGYTFSYLYNNSLTTVNYYYPQAPANVLAGVTVRW